MDQSQNLFRKTNGKIKEHSATTTQVYIQNFSVLKVEVHLAGKDRSTVNLESFINFYINEKFSAAKPYAENP